MLMCNSNVSISDHWIEKLSDYEDHVLTRVLKDFTGDVFNFLLSSYIYLGSVKVNNKQSRKIAIIHYHSNLTGPFKFFDIQNLQAYKKIPSLNELQIAELSNNITSENVTLLAIPNSLEITQLDFIEQCRTLILCDEEGTVDQYDI